MDRLQLQCWHWPPVVGVVVQEVPGWGRAQGQPAPPGVSHTGDILVIELSTKFPDSFHKLGQLSVKLITDGHFG